LCLWRHGAECHLILYRQFAYQGPELLVQAGVGCQRGTAISNEAGERLVQLVPNSEVNAIVHDATSGLACLGDVFNSVGMATGKGVPLSMISGHAGVFPAVSRSGGLGSVNAAVSDGAGDYYIGGSFDTVGGQSRDNLAHILADGSLGSWTRMRTTASTRSRY